MVCKREKPFTFIFIISLFRTLDDEGKLRKKKEFISKAAA